ncbi:MAG TPA: cupredoxin domain-containing protein [Vicinamibacterales bacterium]|nr:cupredoxin domain-containing protein [Vicinamibacterales bacterium]
MAGSTANPIRGGAALTRPLLFACLMAASLAAQDRAPDRREITLVARDHQFIPDRIDVRQDDLVRVTFTSEGRPTSFAVDAYRMLKRAGADQTIVFEFRADQAGTFMFYCSLTSDPQCRDMKGTLVVAPK